MKSLNKVLLLATMALVGQGCNETEYYQKTAGVVSSQVTKSNLENNGDVFEGGEGSEDSSDDGASDDGASDDGSTSSTENESVVIDTFQGKVEEYSKLDILWVIDNSGSMEDEQIDLGQNFSQFIQNFVQEGIDFKMGITTTDGRDSAQYLGGDGRLVGDMSKLTSTFAQSNTQEFLDYFNQVVQVGTNGSGTEKGLNNTKRFLERYYAQHFRSDAYLAVIVLSDEEDSSNGTVQSYVDYIKGLKVESTMAKIYSIVVNDVPEFFYESVGSRYISASSLTSGKTASIKSDFFNVLGDLGETIINVVSSFNLSQKPRVDSVEVYVNGTKSEGTYTYLEDANAVKFNIGFEPNNNDEIEVHYIPE